MRLRIGLVVGQQGAPRIVSGTQPILLTNVATPANATRYLGVVDIANGTTLPTVVSSNTALLAIVAASALTAGGQFVFAAYPIDTAAETNDPVTVTISLAGDPDIVLDFQISGAVPVVETDTLDPTSAVGAWVGAPTVPNVPT
jgi:hypothetical protein